VQHSAHLGNHNLTRRYRVIKHRIVHLPSFEVVGLETWISGQDNEIFGRFWDQCQQDGSLDVLRQISGLQVGRHTQGFMLGVSRVEQDPSNRDFYYMIAVEKPEGSVVPNGFEVYRVPKAQWAAFECRGQRPESIIQTEMYAFLQWLPSSGYEHALAPEMEVYLAGDACEFWLPIATAPSVAIDAELG
jgi:AraC family transcriptional regulator